VTARELEDIEQMKYLDEWKHIRQVKVYEKSLRKIQRQAFWSKIIRKIFRKGAV